jgi:hypothetical protein
MSEILKFLKVHHVVELDKSYSRNPMVKGRIKMLLKD